MKSPLVTRSRRRPGAAAAEIPNKVKAILLDALRLRYRRDRGEIGTDDFLVELALIEERVRARRARPVTDKPTSQGRLLRHLAGARAVSAPGHDVGQVNVDLGARPRLPSTAAGGGAARAPPTRPRSE